MSANFLQRELDDVATDLMVVGEIIQFLGTNPKQGSEEVVATWVEWLGRAVSRIGQDVQNLRAIAELTGGRWDMIALALSAALVAAVAAAYAHGHASGIRQIYAEVEAMAEARRKGVERDRRRGQRSRARPSALTGRSATGCWRA